MTTNNSSNIEVTKDADGGRVSLGVTKRILRWFGANITIEGTGTETHTFPATSSILLSDQPAEFTGFTAKTTPADADIIAIEDSADSNEKKKVTWANVKATLKTYFDTLYAAVSHTHDADRLPAFQARQASGSPTSISAGSRGVVICGTEDLDTGNCHNTTTGKFTPNVAGTYLITVAGALTGATAGKDVWVGIRKNGVDSTVRWLGLATIATAGYGGGSGNINVYLNGSTDYVEFIMYNGDASARNTYTTSSSVVTWWQGHRISASDIAGW